VHLEKLKQAASPVAATGTPFVRRGASDRVWTARARGGHGLVLAAVVSMLLLVVSPSQAQSTYKVIVHPDNPVSALSNSQLSEIFLKKAKTWDDSTPIEPVDLSGEPDVRDAFSRDVHGRPMANVRSFWNQEVFSGRGVPPLELASSAAVVEYVAAHRGAIGYVSPQAVTEGVKVLGGISPPKVLSRVEPNYTSAARAARVSGDVVLSVEVDVNGRVTSARPIKELGAGLTSEAIAAVKKWKFSPATRDGKPVSQEVVLTFHFSP
jgi:TonB family protein